MPAPFYVQKYLGCVEIKTADSSGNLESKIYPLNSLYFKHSDYIIDGEYYQNVEVICIHTRDVLFMITDNPASPNSNGDMFGMGNNISQIWDVIQNSLY